MIFGRRRKAAEEQPTATTDVEPTDAEPADAEPTDAEPTDAEPADGGAEPGARDWAAFDASQDWRVDGPFDISEVDLEADDVSRVDLGALVVTPRPGAELRLQVAKDSGSVVSAMVMLGQSALELVVFAAPRSGGTWAEIRAEVIEATRSSKGTATEVEGPFGTELRRLVPVRTPDGGDGYQPSRTWAVEGPRWLLRGVLYGQAALVEGLADPADVLHDVFASTVVRRGDHAMAAGDVIAMTMPENVRPADPPPPPTGEV